ncbi:hypothetical protein PR202_ga07951 [Eleusine coracana subsp. coracana]|uniref:Uncharacterized protein n=1 Tax=Eleusine coracana subsp. coracana TaxID=191504 RepID=A0AAV5C198_ELECO|nr:hypothetical protein PR202_ga07951 [Eleusine coracana subsp. coracana]
MRGRKVRRLLLEVGAGRGGGTDRGRRIRVGENWWASEWVGDAAAVVTAAAAQRRGAEAEERGEEVEN